MTPDDAFAAELMAQRFKLKAWARRITASAADADDLVGETLLKAWRARASYEPGSELGAWLYVILTRLRYSQMRNEATQRRIYGRPVELEEANGAFPATPPSQDDTLVLHDLGDALDRLPPGQRAVVWLAGIDGAGYEETSRHLGIPTNTVKSRLSRGRAALRLALEGAPC